MSSSPSSGAALVVHLWVGCKELVLHADSGLSPQTTDERRARGEELQGERESLDQRLLDRPTRRAEGTCVHVVRERLRLIARGEPRLKRNDPPRERSLMKSKKRTTMAKLARERKVQERRTLKRERKQAATAARSAQAAESVSSEETVD